MDNGLKREMEVNDVITCSDGNMRKTSMRDIKILGMKHKIQTIYMAAI